MRETLQFKKQFKLARLAEKSNQNVKWLKRVRKVDCKNAGGASVSSLIASFHTAKSAARLKLAE